MQGEQTVKVEKKVEGREDSYCNVQYLTLICTG